MCVVLVRMPFFCGTVAVPGPMCPRRLPNEYRGYVSCVRWRLVFFAGDGIQDEEELEWLAVAKKGHGVIKSEQRRESAETEYHRLLCEESIQQASFTYLLFLRRGLFLAAIRGCKGVGSDQIGSPGDSRAFCTLKAACCIH